MSLIVEEFRENRLSRSSVNIGADCTNFHETLTLVRKWNFPLYFIHFLSDLDAIRQRRYSLKCIDWWLWVLRQLAHSKSGAWKAILLTREYRKLHFCTHRGTVSKSESKEFLSMLLRHRVRHLQSCFWCVSLFCWSFWQPFCYFNKNGIRE